jgi:hypothetical protein
MQVNGGQDGTAWGDEREVQVWGQVSAQTLYLVVLANLIAGGAFDVIDSSRYGPCVLVFLAVAFGATAYSGKAAGRKGVDVRTPADRARLVVSSLVFGVILYAMVRFLAEGHNRHSWHAAVVTVGLGAVLLWLGEDWQRLASRGPGRHGAAARWLARRVPGLAVLVAVSLVYGAFIYAMTWSVAADPGLGGWPWAVPTIICIALGYGFTSRFVAAWDRRRALRS